MEKEVFFSKDNHVFTMEEEVIFRNYCSVRECGYLIVPDGRLIVVPIGKKHHGKVFHEYIEKYLGQSIDEIKEQYEIYSDNGLQYIPLLNSLGIIVYFGTGFSGNILHCGYDKSDRYELEGLLNIPTDVTIITNEQLQTCVELLKTNISFTGKEKYLIKIGDLETGIEYTKDDIDCLLQERRKTIK